LFYQNEVYDEATRQQSQGVIFPAHIHIGSNYLPDLLPVLSDDAAGPSVRRFNDEDEIEYPYRHHIDNISKYEEDVPDWARRLSGAKDNDFKMIRERTRDPEIVAEMLKAQGYEEDAKTLKKWKMNFIPSRSEYPLPKHYLYSKPQIDNQAEYLTIKDPLLTNWLDEEHIQFPITKPLADNELNKNQGRSTLKIKEFAVVPHLDAKSQTHFVSLQAELEVPSNANDLFNTDCDYIKKYVDDHKKDGTTPYLSMFGSASSETTDLATITVVKSGDDIQLKGEISTTDDHVVKFVRRVIAV
jgi:hypothetical protein